MSTANQEGSGRTFFQEREQAGREHAVPPISRPADKRLVSIYCMRSHKMILAENEFPPIHFLRTAAQSHQGGGDGWGAVLNGLYKPHQHCFRFKDMHGDSSEESRDCIPACIIGIFRHAHGSPVASTGCHRSHKQCSEAGLNI